MTDKEYLIALSTFVPLGPVRIKLLLKYFKKAGRIWKSTRAELAAIGLGQRFIDHFLQHRKTFNAEGYLAKLKILGISVYTFEDKGYPENLLDIIDAPQVIYVRGKLLKTDVNAIAVIGSRMMTGYGREVAKKIAGELSSFGITIVSGLALGIDAEAQRAALEAGGRTIAVLASGLDIISPLANKTLALEFIKKNGAIISEYPLGHVPQRSDFAVRNRLISGLSKGVVVIEGRMKSGTFYTVNAAAGQGRPVFAVPGPITSPSSEAPNYLIQNGAKLVTGSKEVLEELNMQNIVDKEIVEKVMPASAEEEKILEILEREALHLDELVRISGDKIAKVSARLTIMEMKGLVQNIGQGMYRKI